MKQTAVTEVDSGPRSHETHCAVCRAMDYAKTSIWMLLTAFVFPLLRAGGSESELKPLRLGFFPNITHAQALYGRATGEFERAVGVPVQWIAFNAGPSAIEALFVDAVDATFIGPSPTINGCIKSQGQKFVIVAGSASGGAGLVVREGAGIATDKDFNAKVIATPQLGNTQDVAARHWFASKHYRLKERGGTVSLVPLSNPDQLTMFKKKQIDGAWTIEPWLSRLELEAAGRLFLEEKTLWPEGRYVTALCWRRWKICGRKLRWWS